MRKTIALSSVLILVLSACATAQISISNTFLPAPGTDVQSKQDASIDSAFYASLIAGSGGPMTWDFSSRTYSTVLNEYVVDPATVPAIDSFPGANLVLLLVTGVDSAWIAETSNSAVYWLKGNVVRNVGTQTVLVFKDSTPDWVFPVNYGDNWMTHHSWSLSSTPPIHTDYYDTTSYTVDAWGTAKYLSNSVPCLRVLGHERSMSKVYNGTTLIDSIPSEFYTVYFVGSGFSVLVNATRSLSSGTQYTEYASSDFLNQVTDVSQDGSTLPDQYALEQNYPNPFNPSTEIHFSLPQNSYVRLIVYNILGQAVKTLVDQSMSAGSYVADWDGTDAGGTKVASGIYLYRVEAGQFSETKKMVLLK
jgi:hypothetical protein